MRFGLVGTGHWARTTYAPGLAAASGAVLAGVWGRDPAKAAALAADTGARPYDDVAAMVADVDAVAFAVPPDVQVDVALRAARAGRHLLLEKPVATSAADAAAVADAVDEAGVASVVFVTGRYQPDKRAWLDRARQAGGWEGASALWLSAALGPGSPYAGSRWRHEKGGLWDVGPHALSMLTAALGPVTGVTAAGGRRDLVHLVLEHEGGATSTVSLTMTAPPSAARAEVVLWGPAGTSAMPGGSATAPVALATAVDELLDAARTGTPHPCDARFGAEQVAVLAAAERQVAGRR